MKINSFKDKETEELVTKSKINKKSKLLSISNIVNRKIGLIRWANSISDLKIPPNNKLKKLSNGEWSIRINNKYRITFTEKENELYNFQISNHYDD